MWKYVYKCQAQGTVKPLLYPLCPISNPRRPRRLLIFPQIQQHLPELLFARPAGSTFRPLTAQIDKLADALPACPTRRGIFSVCEKLLGLFLSLLDTLFSLLPVVLVELVNVLLGFLDGFFFFGGGDLFALSKG